MKITNANCLTSACRYCRFYKSQGRRGGTCEQLNVPVEANWKSCSLALPPFISAWESLDEIMLLENSFNIDSDKASKNSKVEAKV